MRGDVPEEIAGWVRWAKRRGPVRDVQTGRVGVLVHFPIPAPWQIRDPDRIAVKGRSAPNQPIMQTSDGLKRRIPTHRQPIMQTSDGLKRRIPTHRLEAIPVDLDGIAVPVPGVRAAEVRGVVTAVRLASVTAPADVVVNWVPKRT